MIHHAVLQCQMIFGDIFHEEKNVFCKTEKYVVFHLHKVLHSGNLLLSFSQN